jgi:hypothetical protein
MAKRQAETIDFQVTKRGPNGRPAAEVLVDASIPLNQAAGLVQKHITRNTDILKKVGLRACPACISGFDIWFRHRFDEVLQIDLKQIG